MPEARILIVDDDTNVVRALMRTINCLDCEFYATDKPEEAICKLYSEKFDIIITDQKMPRITGIEILKEAQKIDSSIIGILITGYSDMEVAVSAINDINLFRYISKPWDNDNLANSVNKALALRKERINQIKIINEIELHREAAKKFSEQVNRMKIQSKNALLKVLKAKDYEVYEHSVRVSQYATLIADIIGINSDRKEILRQAALLHDIGKVAIKDQILDKPEVLDENEFMQIKNHPKVGFEILNELDDMQEVALIVYQHHERLDGKGYPLGIRDIFLMEESKILSVADAYDALTSDRVYRKALSKEEAVSILMEGTKGQYDIEIVKALIGGLNGR